MNSASICLIFSVLIAAAYGKSVVIRTTRSASLTVNVNGADHVVTANIPLIIDVTDTATITATPTDATVLDSPKTKVEITVGLLSDQYSVNLEGGFNLAAKVIPVGGLGCSAAVCAADILSSCPVASQVTDSLGAVVGCQNSPALMNMVCPKAVVDSATAGRVQLCSGATSYMVIF